MDYKISIVRLVIILLSTILMYYSTIKHLDNIYKKVYIGIFYLSFFLYSGFGISILPDYMEYTIYYFAYLSILTVSIIKFSKSNIRIKYDPHLINRFINKFGKIIILIFIILYFSNIIYPINKISNIIHPPSIDNTNILYSEMSNDGSDAFTKIVRVLINLVYPFYIISLILYTKKPIKLLILIILPIYLNYCATSYIGRSSIVLNFVFYFAILYFYFEKYRKRIVFVAIIGMISFLPILTYLFFVRTGGEVSLMSTFDIIDPLIRIELTFPLWFKSIVQNADKGYTYISDYLIYIIAQPIPGFLKQWAIGNFQVNYSIAEILLGVKPTDKTFFVPLTGLVSESIFIFGKYFFWIHAILLGFMLNLFINFLSSNENFKILVVYALVFTSSIAGRAGTTAEMFFPFIIKTIIYVPIILVLYSLTQTTALKIAPKE